MRNFVVNTLAECGVWCCQKSIKLADAGYIDFEVSIPENNSLIIYHHKSKSNDNCSFILATTISIITGVAVWVVLNFFFQNNF